MTETPPPTTPPSTTTAQYGVPVGAGAPGEIRSTGMCIVLTIVTLGIYSLFWFYKTHEEMKRYSGVGIGGAVALVITIVVGVVTPFITSNEVGGLYERAGQVKPVTGTTGLWYFPGAFIIVGPLIWFIKTNGALNDFWRSVGVADG